MSKVLMKGVPIKNGHELGFPVIAEEKLDGVRCLVQVLGTRVNYISYAGKELHNLGVYDEMWLRQRDEANSSLFDCEFVYRNFDLTYKVTRSKTPPSWFDRAEGRFYLLDFPDRVGTYRAVEPALLAIATSAYPIIQRPRSRVCRNIEEVQRMMVDVVSNGGEGLMLKEILGLYLQGGRSKTWGKLKRQETADGRILAVRAAISKDGVPKAEVGSFLVEVQSETGEVATAQASASKLTTAEKRNMWANREQFVGKWCELQFMQRDRAGGFRHPVFLRIREDK